MTLSEKIKNRERYIAVVGLGYVGLPLAVAFAGKGLKVIGFDISERSTAGELYCFISSSVSPGFSS